MEDAGVPGSCKGKMGLGVSSDSGDDRRDWSGKSLPRYDDRDLLESGVAALGADADAGPRGSAVDEADGCPYGDLERDESGVNDCRRTFRKPMTTSSGSSHLS